MAKNHYVPKSPKKNLQATNDEEEKEMWEK